jgi:hypothetical protein
LHGKSAIGVIFQLTQLNFHFPVKNYLNGRGISMYQDSMCSVTVLGNGQQLLELCMVEHATREDLLMWRKEGANTLKLLCILGPYVVAQREIDPRTKEIF